MGLDQEMGVLILVATGVVVVNAPTALQVLWLIGVGLAVALTRVRGRGLPGSEGDGGGGRGPRPGPRPPMGTM